MFDLEIVELDFTVAIQLLEGARASCSERFNCTKFYVVSRNDNNSKIA